MEPNIEKNIEERRSLVPQPKDVKIKLPWSKPLALEDLIDLVRDSHPSWRALWEPDGSIAFIRETTKHHSLPLGNVQFLRDLEQVGGERIIEVKDAVPALVATLAQYGWLL